MRYGLNGIGVRIAIIMVVLIATVVALGYVAYSSMAAANASAQELVNTGMPKDALIAHLVLDVTDMKSQQRTLLIPFDKAYLDKQFVDVKEVRDAFDKDLRTWESFAADVDDPNDAEVKAWDEFKVAYGAWIADHETFMKLVRGSIDNGDQAALAQARGMATGGMRDKVKILVVAIVAVLLGIVATIMLERSISTPLRRAVDYAEAVSHGDMDVEFGTHENNEIGELTRATEAMKEGLVRRIGQLSEVAATVALAAEAVDDTAGKIVATTDELRIQMPSSIAIETLADSAEDLARKSNNLRSAVGAFGTDSEG
jgi:methyl-accepting chemotaxis protein